MTFLNDPTPYVLLLVDWWYNCYKYLLVPCHSWLYTNLSRNFKFASKLRSEGIYMVNPSSERSNPRNSFQPVKVMSIDGLKRALRFVKHYFIFNWCVGLLYWLLSWSPFPPFSLIKKSTSMLIGLLWMYELWCHI